MRLLLVALIFPLFSSITYAKLPPKTDEAIREILIQKSIDSYPGNCPCPYNSARNGSSCGKRSAYSRAGGYTPLCYPEDVNQSMVEKYKQNHKK